MAKDLDVERFGVDAMNELISGDESAFTERMKQFNPKTIRSLYHRSKELGTASFQTKDYPQAIEYYSGSLALAETAEEKSRLFSNRSSCYLNMGRYADALYEAEKSIAMNPKWSKVSDNIFLIIFIVTFYQSWFRAGRALVEMHQDAMAQSAYKRANELTVIEGINNQDLLDRFEAVNNSIALVKCRHHIQ